MGYCILMQSVLLKQFCLKLTILVQTSTLGLRGACVVIVKMRLGSVIVAPGPESNAAAHYDGDVYKETEAGYWTKNPGKSWSEYTNQEKGMWFAKMLAMFFIPLFVFATLFVSRFHSWAIIEHPDFDSRPDVYFGSWSVCSEHYKNDMPWATVPWYSHCTDAYMDACFQAAMPACTDVNHADHVGFADRAGNNKKYELAWNNCRAKCNTRRWQDYCAAKNICHGSGQNHRDQCFNVTVVEKGLSMATLTYKPRSATPGFAWVKDKDEEDNHCKPIDDICDNGKTLLHIGNLAWAGWFFAAGGFALLLAFIFRSATRKLPIFLTCLVFFLVSWLLLLISWSIFAAELEKQVTCTVVDSVAWGCGDSATPQSMCAVTAKGRFGDLIDPMAAYPLVVTCWVLLTFLIIGLIIALKFIKPPEPETSQI